MKATFNRRKAVAVVAATASAMLSPYELIAKLLTSNSLSTAQAQSASGMRYIFIQQPGAPARWMYDLFLNPDNQNTFVSNTQVASEFTAASGVHTGVNYKLVNLDGTWVPPMWDVPLPTSGSGTAKLRTLLPNMLHIRGINTANASHPFCQRLHMVPIGAARSLTSLTAISTAPIAAVNMSTEGYALIHPSGILPVDLIGSSNLIANLMGAFKYVVPASFAQQEASLRTEISAAEDAINAALSPMGGNSSVKDSSDRARQIVQANFPDFDAAWTTLVTKYQDIIDGVVHSTIFPGINNAPIGVPAGSRDSKYNHAAKKETLGDLRALIKPTSTIARLASSFAATEYIIVNDLSRSLAFSVSSLTDLNSGIQSVHNIDEHGTGVMVSLFLNTILHASLGACVMELIDSLKQRNLFDKTVIDVSGEFNRSPRNDGTGSDHGFEGASVALYSGRITNGPHILGDISNATNGKYSGTWGVGAANAEISGAGLNVGHFASTLAALLDAPSPVSAAPSLISFNSAGVIQPKLRRGRII